MPIVAAGILPHQPLLVPSIAKQHAGTLDQTRAAITELVADGYAAKPDVLIFLSPHERKQRSGIIVETAEHYHGDLVEFGDLTTTVDIPGVIGVIHELKMVAEDHHCLIQLQSDAFLDYGITVPYTFFSSALPHVPILPITLGTSSTVELLRFGSVLYDFCTKQNRRFAVYASADFTRRRQGLPSVTPRPSAEERQVSAAVTTVDSAQAAAIHPQRRTCGLPPTIVLLGMLNHGQVTGRITSFAAPLGIGLLTASFQFGA